MRDHMSPGDVSRMLIYGIDVETGARSEFRRVVNAWGQEDWVLVRSDAPLETENQVNWKKEGF